MPELPQTPPNRMAEARAESIRLARERLAGTALDEAAARVGLEVDGEGAARIAVFGKVHRVMPETFGVEVVGGGKLHPVDEFLILRYLEAKREVKPRGSAINFRDLPGGAFYFGPMSSRSNKLILKTFGNDIDRLRSALERYPCDPVAQGDLGVAIHAIGAIDVTLIYRLGDEEFPASVDILYDRVIGEAFTTDEVAALTTRLCVGLLGPAR